MQAMMLTETSSIDTNPLKLREAATPTAGSGEVLIKVEACGICRTDLHVVEDAISGAGVLVMEQ